MIQFRDLLESPFVDGGREPGKALDCYGLFMEAMKRNGVELGDFQISCFASALISEEVQKHLAQHWRPVKTPQAGDGVAIAADPQHNDMVQHFGVMVDSRRFLHTLEKTGPLLTKIDDFFWSTRIRGFYRWRP